ncbi:acyl carrier protein [Streptomyces sp. RKAG290]|uniref:acyl carrier protein n=1 Tax=Streptomyces sp. RKAG290 TaxID=2888348 RepID=UPI0020344705|nr:acyl carrier protein [Streptomyces sp. RKAG290]MCM2414181.1 acyl carrier protein [Streptomyces sp. RKAG290]
MDLKELTTLLRDCAGVGEGVDLDGDVLDVPFDDLGYDSLAILQVTGVIERDYHIQLSDDTVAEASTPRILLEFINDCLSSTAKAA